MAAKASRAAKGYKDAFMEERHTEFCRQVARAFENERIIVGEITINPEGQNVIITMDLLGVRRTSLGHDQLVDVEKSLPQRLLRAFPQYYDFADAVAQEEDGKKWKRVVRFKVPAIDISH